VLVEIAWPAVQHLSWIRAQGDIRLLAQFRNPRHVVRSMVNRKFCSVYGDILNCGISREDTPGNASRLWVAWYRRIMEAEPEGVYRVEENLKDIVRAHFGGIQTNGQYRHAQDWARQNNGSGYNPEDVGWHQCCPELREIAAEHGYVKAVMA